jgi:pantetheine-phosphate adenylyltransferase
MRIAVYPGTFDPVTKGHEALVIRAIPLFDQIIVAIGHNAKKQTAFSLEQRIDWLKEVFAPYPTIQIAYFSGLTIQFCEEKQAKFILRGLRSSTDFEYERNISQANAALNKDIETIFMVSDPGLSAINSSIVRDIYRHGGDTRPFLPHAVSLPRL